MQRDEDDDLANYIFLHVLDEVNAVGENGTLASIVLQEIQRYPYGKAVTLEAVVTALARQAENGYVRAENAPEYKNKTIKKGAGLDSR